MSKVSRCTQNVLTGVTGGVGSGKSAQPATCLLVLLLSVALVALPSVRDELRPRAPPPAAAAPLTRALLSATNSVYLALTYFYHQKNALAPSRIRTRCLMISNLLRQPLDQQHSHML